MTRMGLIIGWTLLCAAGCSCNDPVKPPVTLQNTIEPQESASATTTPDPAAEQRLELARLDGEIGTLRATIGGLQQQLLDASRPADERAKQFAEMAELQARLTRCERTRAVIASTPHGELRAALKQLDLELYQAELETTEQQLQSLARLLLEEKPASASERQRQRFEQTMTQQKIAELKSKIGLLQETSIDEAALAHELLKLEVATQRVRVELLRQRRIEDPQTGAELNTEEERLHALEEQVKDVAPQQDSRSE